MGLTAPPVARSETAMPTHEKKPYKGLPMEGFTARWYARTTARDLSDFRELARRLADMVPADGRILEVAPGPGYLAIALAQLGEYRIVGLDVSKTFVKMAAENAARAGVSVEFREGDAAALSFGPDSFDLIVCRAAFKNFSAPVLALTEMHRVLRPGGKALIIDLRRDASAAAINAYVRGMGFFNSLLTRGIFKFLLLPRAYSQDQMREMVERSPFRTCEIRPDPIGMEVELMK
jgi:ubiquinone/menaquinone biosynthesis C-methylase UbiE